MVAAIETSRKMASILCQNGFKNLVFCLKPQNIVHFGPYDLVQSSPVGSQNTYQIMYRETLEFEYQRLQR